MKKSNNLKQLVKRIQKAETDLMYAEAGTMAKANARNTLQQLNKQLLQDPQVAFLTRATSARIKQRAISKAQEQQPQLDSNIRSYANIGWGAGNVSFA